MALAIVHEMNQEITAYELVTLSTDKKKRSILTHKIYGKYYCTPGLQLCYEDGELWDIPRITVQEVDQTITDKLLESPQHNVFRKGNSFYNHLYQVLEAT